MRQIWDRVARPDPRFVIEDHEPVYLQTWRNGLLNGKVATALRELEECRVCPRNCRINRLKDERRVCNTGRHAVVSSAFPHFGEEDCLRGHNGSGTIFFGLCNLRCVFCQNWDISQKQAGIELDAAGIADLALDLQARGCHNINFVTPEHVVPQVLEAIAVAVRRGLRVPIVGADGSEFVQQLVNEEGLVGALVTNPAVGRSRVIGGDGSPRRPRTARVPDLTDSRILLMIRPCRCDHRSNLLSSFASRVSEHRWSRLRG